MSKENFTSRKQKRKCRIRPNSVWKHITLRLRRALTPCQAQHGLLYLDYFNSLCKEPEPVREMLRPLFYRGEKLHVSRVLKVTWLQSDKIRILTLLAPAHNRYSVLPLLLETKRQRPIIS